MGRRKNRPNKAGAHAPRQKPRATARSWAMSEPGEPIARLGDQFKETLAAVKIVATPATPPVREESQPAQVVHIRPRDAGEALTTIDELRRVNRALQARLADLEGQHRQTLEALSRQVRERDERIGELERSTRRLEAELSDRGDGTNRLRLRERELEAQVAQLQADLQVAREELLDAQTADTDTAATALIAAFRRLVTVDLPSWSDHRDVFLRNAQRIRKKVVSAKDEASRTLFLLRSSLERAADTTGEVALRRAGAQGVEADELSAHALALEIKSLWETWQTLAADFDRQNLERDEYIARDVRDRRERDQLRRKIESVVHAFSLARQDIWELADLDASALSLLDDRATEIDAIHGTFEIERVSAGEEQDIARATRTVLAAPPPRDVARTRSLNPAPTAPVEILPGQVFPTQSERELERLCLLAVMAWEQAPSARRRHLTVVKIRAILMESRLVRKDTSIREVLDALKAAKACQALRSGALREGDSVIEAFSSAARAPVCRDEALDLLAHEQRERVLDLLKRAATDVKSRRV